MEHLRRELQHANIQQNRVASHITHLLYAFGNVAPTTGAPDAQCHIADSWADYQTPYLPSVSGAPYPGPLYGNFAALQQLKELHPNLKVLISLGGASQRTPLVSLMPRSTPALRSQLVASCLDLFINGNLGRGVSAAGVFDGIDIDWEFSWRRRQAKLHPLVKGIPHPTLTRSQSEATPTTN